MGVDKRYDMAGVFPSEMQHIPDLTGRHRAV